MTEPIIICPGCKTEIRLTESLAAPLVEVTRREYERRLTLKDNEVASRESALSERENALVKASASLENSIAEKLQEERPKIAADEARKVRQALASDIAQKTKEITELQDVLKQRDAKLAEAQQAQTDLLRKQRELEDAKREVELTVEKRLQEELASVRAQALRQAEDEFKLKVLERELTITSMQKQIEDLKRRAEQGSQQLQGEVQEIELEALLKTRFPGDTIEAVPKGQHGGDILQRVVGSLGQPCGTIIWESKRTRNWSDGWLAKLREDQRSAKAEIAIIVSQALPQNVEVFDLVDQVWVTHPRAAMAVAATLRQSLVELAVAHQAFQGQHTKMEVVYRYITSSRFRQRIQAVVEAFSSMQEDLNREKKAITKQWSKREEQIQRIMQAAVGMYGDLQGMTGKTLEEIDELALTTGEGIEIGVSDEGSEDSPLSSRPAATAS